MGVAVIFLTGCAHTPAPLFPDPLPAMELPTTEPLPAPQGDDCPMAMPWVPGDLAPFTDDSGAATCRGVLLPQSRAVEALQHQDRAEYFEARATICHRYRQTDREYAESVYLRAWEDGRAWKREGDVLRLAVPAAAIVGVIVGVAVGIVADDVAGVVP